MRAFSRGLRVACVCAAWLCSVPARAHAPLPRAVAVSANGAVALALPGFGLLIRSGADGSFAYACDALLGIPPSDEPVALQYFDDDTLLLAGAGGLRRVAADGCPTADQHPLLGAAPVQALAIHSASQVAYVVAAGVADGVWRSSDRGVHWERRGGLQDSQRVNGLAVDPGDPTQLIASWAGAGEMSALLVSSDGGASFASYSQDRAVRVLALQAAPALIWAVARARDSKGNRGFDILRARGVHDAFSEVLRVNYFGGLTIAGDGQIWVGDEGGGIYDSSDSGDSFTDRDARSRVACLASTTDALWACTPGVASAPALRYWVQAAGALQPAVAFTDVTKLVSCPGGVDVSSVCEAAWTEWQRDVLMRDLTSERDVLPPPTAAATAADAGSTSPSPQPQPQPQPSCSVSEAKPSGRAADLLRLLVIAAAWTLWRARAVRRRPRQPGSTTDVQPPSTNAALE